MAAKTSKNRRLIRAKAQSLVEYAVVIACIIAALLAMQHYLKRGLQGRLKVASDSISEEHYASDNIESETETKLTTKTEITQKEVAVKDGSGKEMTMPNYSNLPITGVETTVKAEEKTEKSGNERIGLKGF